MQKWWSVLFAVVLLACFLSLVISPAMGWWLPSNVSSFGGEVDYLFYVILGFTGFFFIVTETILIYTMYKYAYDPERKASNVGGNHKLELGWTIVPAVLLLYIAFAQISAWAKIKYESQMPDPDQVVRVQARQWEWRLRYADVRGENNLVPEDHKLWALEPQFTDIHVPNELHTWKDANVRLYLATDDVLHSFFIPNLRLKQDAVPGKTIPMWFRAEEANVTFDEAKGIQPIDGKEGPEYAWEIACAELCGTRHYAMRGRLYVYETKEQYLKWLAHAKAEDTKTTRTGSE